MKEAEPKPKPPRPPAPPHEAWFGPDGLLPATFRWEEPALDLPTRRDASALPHILGMDRAARTLHSLCLSAPEGTWPDLSPTVRELHREYESWQADQIARNGLEVRCGAGCGACCHQYPLEVHAFEILHLHGEIRARDDYPALIEACRRRAVDYREWQEYAALTYPAPAWDDDDRTALAQEHDFDENRPCLFLDGGRSCSVHAARPFTCRMFLSLSDPQLCTSELNTAPGTRQFTLPPEEAVTLRLERVDRCLPDWGHDGSLYGSLAALHDRLEGAVP
jgi:Fe-S-cluster containining protein